MYVFDRGYLDHMSEDRYFFISRLRKNAVVRVLESFSLPKDSTIITDKMVVIGTSQNALENAFRLIKLLDTKGNELHLLTNCFDLSAVEIAEIYKSCWAIELFFEWMKQQLNIKKF